jgi:hypothetical protein
MDTATVPVKSAMTSKVNWLQVISALATVATAIISAANLSAAQAAEYTAAVAGIGQIATIIVKTFFTTTITPSSAAKLN